MLIKSFINAIGIGIRIVLIFTYLVLAMLSLSFRPIFHPEFSYKREFAAFFYTTKMCSVCLERHHHFEIDAIIVCLVALFGYIYGYRNVKTCVKNTDGTYDNKFFISEFPGLSKYSWICFAPWLFIFAQYWLINIIAFIQSFDNDQIFETSYVYVHIGTLSFIAIIQLMLFSEVLGMAVRGWRNLEYINNEWILWERYCRKYRI